MPPKEATKTAVPETSGRAPMSATSAVILKETVKKQLRFHHLFENYMLSPSVIKNLVITNKPTIPLIKEGIDIQEIARLKSNYAQHNDNYHWKTEGQVYGEDTTPLVRLTDPRFYHPKTVTDITKKYGTALKAKEK